MESNTAKEGIQPREPDEIVVDLSSVLEERKAKRVLDLGCGAGRHVIYLTEQGFESYGAEISETGLKLTKKRLRSRSHKMRHEIDTFHRLLL